MTKIYLTIIVLIVVIIFLMFPLLGYILMTVTVIFLSSFFTKKHLTNYGFFSFAMGLVFYLLFNDYVTKNHAQMIVHEVFVYKQKNDIVPETLDDILQIKIMQLSPSFVKYVYERRNETEESYQWKLEFKNIWGTEYFYDDKTGDIEKVQNWQGNNHWNEFRKSE